MKQIKFISELFTITEVFDGDGNGLCGCSYQEVAEMLEKEYPTLFEAYKMLEGAKENVKMR